VVAGAGRSGWDVQRRARREETMGATEELRAGRRGQHREPYAGGHNELAPPTGPRAPDAHGPRFSAAIAANSSQWQGVWHHCGPCARRSRGRPAAQVAAVSGPQIFPRLCADQAMADALELLKTRRSIKPVELAGPGPSKAEIETLLTIASRVPDHGKLVPWRFIIFEGEARLAAGDTIAVAFCAKYPQAKAEHIEAERTRLARAPLVIAVVSRAAPHVKIPEWEQVLSAVAAATSPVLAAHALGPSADRDTGSGSHYPRGVRAP